MNDEVEVLYSAANSSHGLVIKTSNFELARARLYAARKRLGDPALDALQIRRGPNDELWLIPGRAPNQPTHSPSSQRRNEPEVRPNELSVDDL